LRFLELLGYWKGRIDLRANLIINISEEIQILSLFSIDVLLDAEVFEDVADIKKDWRLGEHMITIYLRYNITKCLSNNRHQ